jgi:hypothetical protein
MGLLLGCRRRSGSISVGHQWRLRIGTPPRAGWAGRLRLVTSGGCARVHLLGRGWRMGRRGSPVAVAHGGTSSGAVVRSASAIHQWRLRMAPLRSARRVWAFLNGQFQCLFDIAPPLSRMCANCRHSVITSGDYASRPPPFGKAGIPLVDQCQCLLRTELTSLGDGRAGRDSNAPTGYSHVM